MNYERAMIIFLAINESSNDYLKKDLFETAVEYAQIRANWTFYDEETRINKDNWRTNKHNSLIDSCNILSRDMLREGKDNSWRNEVTNDRQLIGDFACFLHAILGIKNR